MTLHIAGRQVTRTTRSGIKAKHGQMALLALASSSCSQGMYVEALGSRVRARGRGRPEGGVGAQPEREGCQLKLTLAHTCELFEPHRCGGLGSSQAALAQAGLFSSSCTLHGPLGVSLQQLPRGSKTSTSGGILQNGRM